MSIDNGGYGGYFGSGTPKSEVIWNGYKFEPKPDITPYELALATRAMLTMMAHTLWKDWGVIEELPQEAKRHFQKEE